MLVLMAIQDMIGDLGCTSVTTVASVDQALKAIENQPFDLATLDVNLNGCRSYPVADSLGDHGVPFAFSTGYGDHGIGEAYRGRPVLTKPYSAAQLAKVLAALLASAGVGRAGPLAA